MIKKDGALIVIRITLIVGSVKKLLGVDSDKSVNNRDKVNTNNDDKKYKRRQII